MSEGSKMLIFPFFIDSSFVLLALVTKIILRRIDVWRW
jgi:hypothetical protein